MKSVILALTLVLSGCAILQKDPAVTVRTEYIVRTASDAQKALPPQPSPIDVTKATQAELAYWILATEKRMMNLETLINRLIEFYESPVRDAEKPKVEKKPEAK